MTSRATSSLLRGLSSPLCMCSSLSTVARPHCSTKICKGQGGRGRIHLEESFHHTLLCSCIFVYSQNSLALKLNNFMEGSCISFYCNKCANHLRLFACAFIQHKRQRVQQIGILNIPDSFQETSRLLPLLFAEALGQVMFLRRSKRASPKHSPKQVLSCIYQSFL